VAGSGSEVIHLQPDALVRLAAEGIAANMIGPDVTRTSVISPTSAVVGWVGAVVDD
jgi:hypothetical protein